jgi:hypothetical protein
MFLLNKTEHALVTVYGDGPEKALSSMISGYIPDRDLRVLTPGDPKTLEQAAQNSVLAFIVINRVDDPNLRLARILKENRMIVCDIIAFCPEMLDIHPVQILGMGFDLCLTPADAAISDFKKFLVQKITMGNRRLSGLILEEEYKRVCDALSNAPASMIIFDADKRTVFISDHYFRAYPKIATRLVRGLSVFDVFDMMAKEEGLATEDPLYEKLQKYWYNLEGSLEFTIKGVSYRLKAVQLPSRRGTVLMAQNVTGYEHKRSLLEEQATLLKNELEKISRNLEVREKL